MFGKNPILAPSKTDGSYLEVVEIFPTFQGEGPFSGTPSVFIRLGGCNLACNFCDTEFDHYDTMGLEAILQQIKANAQDNNGIICRHLVVITGGEPLRQEIAPLCQALLEAGFEIQIETNGTLWRPLPEQVNIVCSPKATNGVYHPIRTDLLPNVDAFKFIISSSRKPYDQLPELGQTTHQIPVYVQPMDEYNQQKNQDNLALSLQLSNQHNCHLSLQTHKMVGVR